MSGTSLDGVDAVLVDLSSTMPLLLAKHYLPFDNHLKNALLTLQFSGPNELHQLHLASNQLATIYAATVNQLLSQTGNSPDDIIAIGCHGQTIRHCPEYGYTIQIGNPALLTELTGITVVNDFRSRDIAAGGQGAPLVPAFHDTVFRHPHIHRVIVNIGGICNLTNLSPEGSTTGFDCGPGNLLMDSWCFKHLGEPYDDKGRWASTGKLLPSLLEIFLAESFFIQPPPKSSGRDLFNMSWLEKMLQGDERPQDVQATLLEMTCQAISLSIRQYCHGTKEVYLCGGGVHNQTLHNRLGSLLDDCKIQQTESLGINADFLEAIAFAWLAQQALEGKPANLPAVTGAQHRCILGAINYA